MARKSKRKAAARPKQRVAPSTAAPRPATPAPVGAQQQVRSLEMTLAPRQQQRGVRGRIVLENADPAIPLDRVPYFLGDLRNLGIVAVIMVILLIAGSRLIPFVVH